MTDRTGHSDPSNYRKMQEPLASTDAASEAWMKFCDAVEKARNECHICDVHVIGKIIYITDSGAEGQAMSSAHFGNSLDGIMMAAWAYGREQEYLRNITERLTKP